MTECTPLYDWLDERSAGVLLPISSLPGSYGIGNFGSGAYRFLDFLSSASFRLWQICPLGPTGYGDSPYQCFSAFAGNPYFIDLKPLLDDGLLQIEELEPLQRLSKDRVDYGGLYELFPGLLEIAYERFSRRGDSSLLDYGDIDQFRTDNESWLIDYALFMALKDSFNGQPWLEWPPQYRSYATVKKSKLSPAIIRKMDALVFQQYLFAAQFKKLREEASRRGIQLMGDIPIFVAMDSADVWSKRELFDLNKSGKPKFVAGVPPDLFSEDGQLWGNPLYKWENHQSDGFDWWIERILANSALFDIIRLDHFRGFESYWAVPTKEKTARKGKWLPCPGLALFQSLQKACPDVQFVAEDLGVITKEVDTLCQQTGLPRMAVLQFAFGENSENPFLPHNVVANQVIYTGTHDNETTVGWYASLDEHVRDHIRRYLGVDGKSIAWDFIRAAIRSPARLAIIPMQDLLSLDNAARLNTPGQPFGNWQWRLHLHDLERLEVDSVPYLVEQLALYGRINS